MGSSPDKGQRTAVGRLESTSYSILYYHLCMKRPSDQETGDTEKKVAIIIDPKRSVHITPWGGPHMERTRVDKGQRGRDLWARALIVVYL